jgi:hypothetical protein
MSLGSVSPPSPRMSGGPFCPLQRWQTFFRDLWEQMLPQSSCCLLSRLWPLLLTVTPLSHGDYALCLSMTCLTAFGIYSTTLPDPRGMIV